MAVRKPFLLRVEPGLLAALEQWAAEAALAIDPPVAAAENARGRRRAPRVK